MSLAPPPRRPLTHDAWTEMASASSPPLLALWADTREVYALLRDGDAALLVSTEVEDGGYPALSAARPAAAWFERMVRDLWGHIAVGGTDQRPLLDHGRWARSAPLSVRPGPPAPADTPEYPLAPELDQLPLGPVRGDIAPAAHLRLGISGETIVRLEARLGYTHKGTLSLMRGKSPRAAARFAARLVGEATVAHSIAFARATEAALGCEIPSRAATLRAVMAELERIAGRLDGIAATAEAAGRDWLATRAASQTEAIRRAAQVAFGHRLMMDCVIPGGVAADIAPGGSEALGRALPDVAAELPECAGAIRRTRALLLGLSAGPVAVPLPPESGEGVGHADGPHGEIWHWLKLDHGQIASAFLLDPAWTRWAALETAASGSQLEELPRMMAEFGLSSSGLDL
jgi:Ni,Fe-hydrogenase III large subunit